MPRAQIHFELYVRRHRRASWTLTLASETRAAALAAAQDALSSGTGAVRVSKETLDPDSGLFRSLTLLERGPLTRQRQRSTVAAIASVPPAACARPRDLYAPRARAVIGRVLSAWLARHGVTPFELLHRGDLAERLEACAAELSAAVQAAAADDARQRGAPTAQTQDTLARLARQAIGRLCRSDPDGEIEPELRAGVALAAQLACVQGWAAKAEALLDALDQAPALADRSGRWLPLWPLAELLGAHADLGALFGLHLPPGAQALALLSIAAPPTAVRTALDRPAVRRTLPPLPALGARLTRSLHSGPRHLVLRRAAAGRALALLAGEDRLWPGDPLAELDALDAGMTLLHACGRLVDQDAVTAAHAGRWIQLSSQAFVDQRLGRCCSALEDVEALIEMAEQAHGAEALANLGRHLCGLLVRHEFEVELRYGPDPLRLRLGRLAGLVRRIGDSPLPPALAAEARGAARRLAARIEADGRSAAGLLATHPLRPALTLRG